MNYLIKYSRLTKLLLPTLLLGGRLSGQTPSPASNISTPGFYRIMVGTFQVTALSDGTVPYPMDKLLTNTTSEAVDAALARSFIREPYPTSINCFLINTGSRLILIDTGAGQLLGNTLGKLVANMRASGYDPSQVNEIYLTHLHVDHEGGLVLDSKPVFPRATVRVSAKDADFWLSARQAKEADEQVQKNKTPRTQFVQENFRARQK